MAGGVWASRATAADLGPGAARGVGVRRGMLCSECISMHSKWHKIASTFGGAPFLGEEFICGQTMAHSVLPGLDDRPVVGEARQDVVVDVREDQLLVGRTQQGLGDHLDVGLAGSLGRLMVRRQGQRRTCVLAGHP